MARLGSNSSLLSSGLKFSAKESWELSRARTVAMIGLPIVQGLLPAALALAIRALVNEVIARVNTGGADQDLSRIVTLVLVSMVVTATLAILVPLRNAVSTINTQAIEHSINLKILDHSNDLNFGNFETPAFKDALNHAIDLPGQHVEESLTKVSRSAASLITLTSLVIILANIEPLLIVYLLPLSLPYLAHRWWVSRIRYQILKRRYRTRRWVGYYNGLLTSEHTLPEVRLLHLFPLFRDRIRVRLDEIFSEDVWLVRREFLGTLLFNLAAVVALHVALWQVAKSAIDGSVTVGDLAIFASAAAALRGAVNEMIGSIGSLRWNLLNLQHLQDFFATSDHTRSVVNQSTAAINTELTAGEATDAVLIVDNVDFAYPSTGRPTLRGVSLTVAAGETVALVGANGSGKSTLVKLICGLYPPDTGSVTVGGVEPHGVATSDRRTMMSVVFQNFGDYEATAAESIAFGDWERLLDDTAEVENIANRVGVASIIERLADGYSTQLGHSFGNTSLSGGQKQSLAIARAATRDVPLMVLDEPTANLDAQTEYDIFQRFRAIAKDQATLLIAHRFTTIELADRIVLLNDGEVVETGTHRELLDAGGEYARLYRLQTMRTT